MAPTVRADILEATEESFDRLIVDQPQGPYFLTQLVAKTMIDRVNDYADPPEDRHRLIDQRVRRERQPR